MVFLLSVCDFLFEKSGELYTGLLCYQILSEKVNLTNRVIFGKIVAQGALYFVAESYTSGLMMTCLR